MSQNQFNSLMQQLGEALSSPIFINGGPRYEIILQGLKIHIELRAEEKEILIGASLGLLAGGHYRTEVLREAMKNNAQDNRVGNMAYSKKNTNLIFFEFLPLYELTSDLLLSFLQSFMSVALPWKAAIEAGRIRPQ